jgi:hypothetical protein
MVYNHYIYCTGSLLGLSPGMLLSVYGSTVLALVETLHADG